MTTTLGARAHRNFQAILVDGTRRSSVSRSLSLLSLLLYDPSERRKGDFPASEPPSGGKGDGEGSADSPFFDSACFHAQEGFFLSERSVATQPQSGSLKAKDSRATK